jgi:hypothetical protein
MWNNRVASCHPERQQMVAKLECKSLNVKWQVESRKAIQGLGSKEEQINFPFLFVISTSGF